MAGGRPTDYKDEIADEICARLIEGESLNKICKDDHMPQRQTIYNWKRQNEEFFDKYERARRDQIDTFIDQIIDIADDNTNDTIEFDKNGKKIKIPNKEHMMRSGLRIDTRKWIASKIMPKRFGDKVEVEHSGEVTNKNIEIVLKDDIDKDGIDYVDS